MACTCTIGSLAHALPATEADYVGEAFSTQFGPIPPEELHPLGNGGYVLWDNGMYVEVMVQVTLGEWRNININDSGMGSSEYDVLPEAVKDGYRRFTGGHDFPAPVPGAKRVLAKMIAPPGPRN